MLYKHQEVAINKVCKEKKNIIVAALMLFSLVACAQKEEFAVIYTTINGELIEIAEKELVQSHTLENGKGKIVLKPDVTEIPQDLLIWGDDIITNVDVPKGIISIGNRAFRGFENLTGITISEGVKSIDAQAFQECSRLKTITLPKSIIEIKPGAFQECSNLSSINIPEGVTIIDKAIFAECSSLTSITIPESVTSISKNAFSGCPSLTEFNGKFSSKDHRCLIIDGALVSFAPNDIVNYSIPEDVTSIGSAVFYNCSNLASITIPVGVTSIGRFAFAGCSNLTNVTIPENVTSIGESAFGFTENLKEIYFKSIMPIELSDDIFKEANSDLKIYVPKESVDKYKAAEGWRDYANMIEPYDFE